MNTDTKLRKQIVNLTNITTSVTNAYNTVSTQPMDNDNLKTILTYAIPLSFCFILLVIVFIIGIRQRYRVLEKWMSLKRMRNTNPRFLQSTVLRRDSEYDSYNHAHVKPTLTQQNPLFIERQYHLATIT